LNHLIRLQDLLPPKHKGVRILDGNERVEKIMKCITKNGLEYGLVLTSGEVYSATLCA
jgi:hypothetical protein